MKPSEALKGHAYRDRKAVIDIHLSNWSSNHKQYIEDVWSRGARPAS